MITFAKRGQHSAVINKCIIGVNCKILDPEDSLGDFPSQSVVKFFSVVKYQDKTASLNMFINFS